VAERATSDRRVERASQFELCYWVREELVERDVILDGEVIALDQEDGGTSAC
jgi:hypothetical protein